jgi:primosomal protein N'
MTAAAPTPTTIVRVALDTPADDCFDYVAAHGVAPGDLVVVPFGRRSMVGVAVEMADGSDVPPDRLRPVERHIGWMPPLNAEWMALARFAARYYHRRLGEVMLPALPPSLREAETWDRLGQRAQSTQYRVRDGQGDALLAAVPTRARTAHALAAALAATPDWIGLADARKLCTAANLSVCISQALTTTHRHLFGDKSKNSLLDSPRRAPPRAQGRRTGPRRSDAGYFKRPGACVSARRAVRDCSDALRPPARKRSRAA